MPGERALRQDVSHSAQRTSAGVGGTESFKLNSPVPRPGLQVMQSMAREEPIQRDKTLQKKSSETNKKETMGCEVPVIPLSDEKVDLNRLALQNMYDFSGPVISTSDVKTGPDECNWG